jgi:hypothetical protein
MNTMTVTLYQQGREPEAVEPGGFITQPESGQIVQNVARAAELLGCAPELADVLACGTGYLVYSVFDYEGDANPAAMAVVAELSGTELDPMNEDEVLQGPVLVILG